jgi:hypothetical protein
MTNGLAKETQGCGGIPFGRQQEVDGLAFSICNGSRLKSRGLAISAIFGSH